jgi:hypothetical protein
MIGGELVARVPDLVGAAGIAGMTWTMVVVVLVAAAFVTLGIALARVPASGWKPPTYTSAQVAPGADSPVAPRVGTPAGRSYAERRGTPIDVPMNTAIRTPQFWWIWIIVFLFASAGVTMRSEGSPMIQATFPGAAGPGKAGAFLAVLAIADLAGRLIWSTWADLIGRRRVYLMTFALGAALFAVLPTAGREGNLVQFLAACALIMSVSGAGFAMVPAFVYDTFGGVHVGAINAQLLTAWTAAALAAPRLMDYARTQQAERGLSDSETWFSAMLLMSGLLAFGLVAAWRARNVHTRYHVRPPREGFHADT